MKLLHLKQPSLPPEDDLIVDFPSNEPYRNNIRAAQDSCRSSVDSARPYRQVQLASFAPRSSADSKSAAFLPPSIYSAFKKPSQRSQRSVKSVRFSEDSTMKFMRYPSDREISRRWYTDADYRIFQRKIWRDAARQSAVYIAMKNRDPEATLPTEEVVKCVGIAHLLSDDVRARYNEIKLNRLTHAGAVLGERDRHLELWGCVCETTLANFSIAISKADKCKALKIAYLSGGGRPCQRRKTCA